MEFVGYHGTCAASAEKILKVGFEPSTSVKSRLGGGTYFYISGLAECPISHARNWVFVHSGRFAGATRYFVFKATILAEDELVLDTRTEDGFRAYCETKRELLAKIGEKPEENFDFLIFELLIEAIGYQIIIGIQHARCLQEKKAGLMSYVPNATVLCVTPNNQKCIDAVAVQEEGPIEQ